MADITKLSAKKLHALIAERDAAWTKACDATIAAGMGQMRHSEIVEFAKGSSLIRRVQLSRDYLAARSAWAEAYNEMERRKAYHGSDKPIKT